MKLKGPLTITKLPAGPHKESSGLLNGAFGLLNEASRFHNEASKLHIEAP